MNEEVAVSARGAELVLSPPATSAQRYEDVRSDQLPQRVAR